MDMNIADKLKSNNRLEGMVINQSAVAFGDNSQAILMMPYHPPAEKLPEIWNIPSRNINFTGRIELLKQMTEYFNTKEAKHLVLTAHGLGGIGKTQLTLEYVWQNYKKYKGVSWFNSESRERLINDYVNLGQELRLFAEAEKNISLEEKAKIVKTWLEHPNRAGWLLVYDSALKQDDINNLLPVKEGKILISSRHTHWPQYQTIAVGVFSLIDAQKYMKKMIGEQKFNEEAANQLIKLLGYLPLALAQACAYIQRRKISIADYLELYQKKHEILLNEQLLPQDQYQKAVALTWNITLEQMTKEAPDSVELMYCCTHLHHEQIPESLVPYFFEGQDETELKIKAKQAISISSEYSMINVDEGKKIFSMHSLVQQIILDQLIKQKKDYNYLLKTIDVLIKVYPYGPNHEQMADFILKRIFIPHFNKCLKHVDDNISNSAYKNNIKILKHNLNKGHIYLADAYGDIGDVRNQKELLERILKDQRIFLEKNNPEIAKTLVNLANANGGIGNIHKKIELLEEAIKIEKICYKNDNNETAITLNNLGVAYMERGDLNKAKDSLKKALKIEEKIYDEAHIEIAKTLVSLSRVYNKFGNFKKEEELLKSAAPIVFSYYGNEHPESAKIILGFAMLYNNLGKYSEYKDQLEKIINIFKKHYGESHIEVSRMEVNLAGAYGKMGNSKKKKALLEKALQSFEKFYGKEYIGIASILHNLSNVYIEIGEINKAKEQLEKALKIQKLFYGESHVEVAETLASLGNLYGNLDDSNKQKELLELALKMFESNLGEHNINCAKTLLNLGNYYYNKKMFCEQQPLLEKALKICKLNYGDEHPEIAIILYNLGLNYCNRWDFYKAKVYMNQASNIYLRHPEHDPNSEKLQLINSYLKNIDSALAMIKNDNLNLYRMFNQTTGEYSKESNNDLSQLMKKYNLSDILRSNLEKCLRMAAANNQAEDIDILIKAGININAQDNNPHSKKTALHWAVIKKTKECIQKLLGTGAQFDIKDAGGKTAYDYAKEINDNAILNLFPIQQNSSLIPKNISETVSNYNPTLFAKSETGVLTSKHFIEKKQTILQSHLQKAKILVNTNQNKAIVQIIFTDHRLVQRFTEELHKIGISNLNMKDELRKPQVNVGKDGKEDEYIISLTVDEYNTVLDDRDAYAKLLSNQAQQCNARP